MPPAYSRSTKMPLAKRKDINLIIVPNVGSHNEAGENDVLLIAEACLESTARLNLRNLPSLGDFGSLLPAGSWCFNALLATPTNQEVSVLLAHHRKRAPNAVDLNDKIISGVSIVKLNSQEHPPPALIWWIRDRHARDAQCVEAWEKVQTGQSLPLIPRAESASPASGKGKAPASSSTDVPEECYPEMMRQWRSRASGSHQQAGGQGGGGDPMDIDDDGAYGTTHVGASGASGPSRNPGAFPQMQVPASQRAAGS